MWHFIVERGVGIASFVFALAAQVSGYTNVAIALGLSGVATFFLVAPVIHHAHAWHRKRKETGLRSVEPIHLITFGVVGAFIFGGIALGGVVWATMREAPISIPRGVAATSMTQAAAAPAPPKPEPVILDEEGRRFREELRRFILSDISNVIETFSSFSAGTMNNFANDFRNSRTLSPADRERDEALYNLLETAKQPYEAKIKPLLDAANKPVERLDLDDIATKLKIYSTSYREEANTFYRFLVLSSAKPNADALEKWKAADERASVSFRNLQTFPETAALVERWRGTGVYSGGMYDWYKQRMRDMEATNAK